MAKMFELRISFIGMLVVSLCLAIVATRLSFPASTDITVLIPIAALFTSGSPNPPALTLAFYAMLMVIGLVIFIRAWKTNGLTTQKTALDEFGKTPTLTSALHHIWFGFAVLLLGYAAISLILSAGLILMWWLYSTYVSSSSSGGTSAALFVYLMIIGVGPFVVAVASLSLSWRIVRNVLRRRLVTSVGSRAACGVLLISFGIVPGAM